MNEDNSGSMDEEKIKKLIEKKVEETVEEKVEEIASGEETSLETDNSGLDSLVDEKVAEKFNGRQAKGQEETLEDKEISRRGFLKTLGLGAGGLALASSGAAGSLLSGTTIGGNTAWHAGNDGGGSGLAADTVDGQHASEIGGGDTDGWYWSTISSGHTTTFSANFNSSMVFVNTSPAATGSKKLRGRFYLNASGASGTFYWRKNNNTLFQTFKNNTINSSTTTEITTQTRSFSSQDTFTMAFYNGSDSRTMEISITMWQAT